MEKDIKKIVEWLCVYCTRPTLNGIAERCGYKNPNKIKRGKLEQIAYIDRVLLDIYDHYRIFDNVTNEILVNRCSKKYVIDYVIRECWFNWFDEATAPIKKDTHHELRIMPLRKG